MAYYHIQKLPDKWLVSAGVASFFIGLTPPGIVAKIAMMGLLGGITASMKSMTIAIDENDLQFWFGEGLFKKRYALDDIVCASQFRLKPMHGWGIHWIGNGWLYNVYGLDAVEITMKSGKRIYLGTDAPEELARTINESLGVAEIVKED